MNHLLDKYNHDFKIAYFSFEVGISANIPSYSGGLGILAGDHIKSAADLGSPLVGISLLYREGYMKQRLDSHGRQTPEYPRFNPESLLTRMPFTLKVGLYDSIVRLAVWKFDYVGESGFVVPIFFLDSDIDENPENFRDITRRLYSGDQKRRIEQEAIIGFGGSQLLDLLHIKTIDTYHMNEGHAAFITFALLKKFGSPEEVRKRCVFTIHTPVPAGHDSFYIDDIKKILGKQLPDTLDSYYAGDELNMSKLALFHSRHANGVSKLNGKVVRKMFPNFRDKISHITNGVHHMGWASIAFRDLFDKYLPGWRKDPVTYLQEARSIPPFAIWDAHMASKRRLTEYANAHKQVGYDKNTLTIAFARRAASYKRAHLLFSNIDRLVDIAKGRIQIIFAGKAHPNDHVGQDIIRNIVANANSLQDKVQITYLANYNIWLGRLLTSGVDVWLNTPRRPNEASGTSGMKAALNGALNLSILDGWWAEACNDGINGWAIGGHNDESTDKEDADLLYDILEKKVLPVYSDRDLWTFMMKESIVTAAEFTSHRMVKDYANAIYREEFIEHY